jgi:hypothetical protein
MRCGRKRNDNAFKVSSLTGQREDGRRLTIVDDHDRSGAAAAAAAAAYFHHDDDHHHRDDDDDRHRYTDGSAELLRLNG